jgi:hypothetical protein
MIMPQPSSALPEGIHMSLSKIVKTKPEKKKEKQEPKATPPLPPPKEPRDIIVSEKPPQEPSHAEAVSRPQGGYAIRQSRTSLISPSEEIHAVMVDFYGAYGAEVMLNVVGHVIKLDRRYIMLLRSGNQKRILHAINAIADAVSQSKHAHMVLDRLLIYMSKINYTVSSQQSVKPSESMLQLPSGDTQK